MIRRVHIATIYSQTRQNPIKTIFEAGLTPLKISRRVIKRGRTGFSVRDTPALGLGWCGGRLARSVPEGLFGLRTVGD
jgi:hypothetical protein